MISLRRELYIMDNDFYVKWDGKEIPELEDELTEEELKQMDKDALLDGEPGKIPNWSNQYKADK